MREISELLQRAKNGRTEPQRVELGHGLVDQLFKLGVGEFKSAKIDHDTHLAVFKGIVSEFRW